MELTTLVLEKGSNKRIFKLFRARVRNTFSSACARFRGLMVGESEERDSERFSLESYSRTGGKNDVSEQMRARQRRILGNKQQHSICRRVSVTVALRIICKLASPRKAVTRARNQRCCLFLKIRASDARAASSSSRAPATPSHLSGAIASPLRSLRWVQTPPSPPNSLFLSLSRETERIDVSPRVVPRSFKLTTCHMFL
jgi:hypothetical protein